MSYCAVGTKAQVVEKADQLHPTGEAGRSHSLNDAATCEDKMNIQKLSFEAEDGCTKMIIQK